MDFKFDGDCSTAMTRALRRREYIEVIYINRSHIQGRWFRESHVWHIEGNRLVSSVGEEITFHPAEA